MAACAYPVEQLCFFEPINPPSPSHQIDIIFSTRPDDPAVPAALDAGLKIGCISSDTRILRSRVHITFVDNDYKLYDHSLHLSTIQHLSKTQIRPPKYATVRDIMTPEQCQAEGIAHYPLETILTWADELSQYAKNVILIPKYDCLSEIPKEYVLGYSVETGYGGTPLPAGRFVSRRVHLLGGRWDRQLAILSELGGDVVSLDNNYIQRIAKHGHFVLPDGSRRNLSRAGLGFIPNTRQTCLTLSFGAMAMRLNGGVK